MINKVIGTVRRIITYRRYQKNHIFVSNSARVIDCSFEKEGYNKISHKTVIVNCNIGKGTYLQENCNFVNTNFGRYCSIAPGSKLIVGNHPTSKFVAMHPAFYSGRSIGGLSYQHTSYTEEYRTVINDRYCIVENDVWIGTDAKILGGVTIHNGVVVAAGSIVTKDVPPYAIVAGIPARIVRYRFTEKEIESLQTIQWWDKDDAWIRQNIDQFDDIESFVTKLKKDQSIDK